MEDLTKLSTSATLKTALEYGDLSTRPSLLDSEVDRMKHILTQASNDPVLNFWIDQIDYCLGYQLGLLRPENRAEDQTQQIMLSKHLASLLNGIGQDDPQRDQELIDQARLSVQSLFR